MCMLRKYKGIFRVMWEMVMWFVIILWYSFIYLFLFATAGVCRSKIASPSIRFWLITLDSPKFWVWGLQIYMKIDSVVAALKEISYRPAKLFLISNQDAWINMATPVSFFRNCPRSEAGKRRLSLYPVVTVIPAYLREELRKCGSNEIRLIVITSTRVLPCLEVLVRIL